MSINVTVHGNPISIKRGKMVSGEVDSEFDRRRQIRLQQVRQQSKEIAADVRNRVRKEREKQYSKAEEAGENCLKRWQTRKLMKLQQQYEDCLKEIGTGHINAALEPDPSEELKEITARISTNAEIRGKKAFEQKRNEDRQKEIELNEPLERRKAVKQSEAARALMISNVSHAYSTPKKKKKKRKKVSTMKETDLYSETFSDNENISSNIISKKKEISKNKKGIKKKEVPKKEVPKKEVPKKDDFKKISPKRQRMRINIPSPESCATEQSSFVDIPDSPDIVIDADFECPPCCTKITDRIRERKFQVPTVKNIKDIPVSDEDVIRPTLDNIRQQIEKKASDKLCTQAICKCIQSERHIQDDDCTQETCQYYLNRRRTPDEKICQVDTNGTSDEQYYSEKVLYDITKPSLQMKNHKICEIPSEQLPFVPKTTVHAATNTIQPSNVRYYDHSNRFSKQYIAEPVVQKISKDSIEVHPSSERDEQDEMYKVIQERDKKAYDREIRATEKEKIQKDYKQLMEDLPVLQRQERLASMRTHNPSFHMREERLQELERRRQSRIENIFEKYYQKAKLLETPMITIRPVKKLPPSDDLKLPFQALDITEQSPGELNVAEWNDGDIINSRPGINLLTQKKSAGTKLTFADNQKSQKADSTAQENEQNKQKSEEVDNDSNGDSQEKQKALVELLQRVNKQRELLLKEVSCLPASSNLQNILQDDDILKFICQNDDAQKKKSKEKNFVSTGTSPVSTISPSKTKVHRIISKERKESSSSDSPADQKKKKLKKTSRKQKILIKNEGTQTSPSTVSNERQKPSATPKTTCTNLPEHPCATVHKEDLPKEHAKKLCEIIINMNKSSDIQICKPDAPSTSGKKSIILNVSKPTKISIKSPTNDASSSTTYMSLPEVKKPTADSKSKSSAVKSQEFKDFKDLLRQKPQQTNVDKTDNSKIQTPCICKPSTKINEESVNEITPVLLKYVKKLLCMSRQSIDELTVSSSEISTPGTSIMDTIENCDPFVQLQNIMQLYNLSIDDIQKSLESSTMESTNDSIQQDKIIESVNKCACTDQKKGTVKKLSIELKQPSSSKTPLKRSPPPKSKKSSPPASPKLSPKHSRESSEQSSPKILSITSDEDMEKSQLKVANLVKKTFGLTSEDMQDIPYANVISRYKELTQTCCDKISKLTEMIDNVRLEKERILSPNESDKYETSVTSYLELPKTNNDSIKTDKIENGTARCPCNGSCTDTSMSQDAVDKYLLSISGQTSPTNKKDQDSCYPNEIPVSDRKNKNSDNQNFVPMLQGIPKYEENNLHQANYFLSSLARPGMNSTKSRPPPTLLRNYNLNIDMVPHELSTIAELETVVSSRNISEVAICKAKTPEEKGPNEDESIKSKTSKETTLFKTSTKVSRSPENLDSESQLNYEINFKKSFQHVLKKSSMRKSPQSSSPADEKPELNMELSGVQPLISDISESPQEDMEGVLRNMGLGWAASTLKKTQEALALSSSTSSFDSSYKKRVSFKESNNSSSSNSEISLKKVLSKELIQRISSSSLTNSSELIPHFQDFQDISEARDSAAIKHEDGSHQRTSTPVQPSRSSTSKKELFTGDSDISSVRMYNDENFFLSIPNVSLDTNKSLSKSK